MKKAHGFLGIYLRTDGFKGLTLVLALASVLHEHDKRRGEWRVYQLLLCALECSLKHDENCQQAEFILLNARRMHCQFRFQAIPVAIQLEYTCVGFQLRYPLCPFFPLSHQPLPPKGKKKRKKKWPCWFPF